MSGSWHWFVVIGVIGSLVAMMVLLFSNRKTSGNKTTGHSWDGIEELDSPLPLWWVGLFVGTTLFAIPFLAFYPGLGNFNGLGNWSAQSEHDEAVKQHQERFTPLYAELGALGESKLHSDRRVQQVGRRLFLNHCATCHGVTAMGSFGFPNLTDQAWIWGGDFESVKHSIRNGRSAVMPPWHAALGEAGVQAVTHHVMELANLEFNQSLAEQGAQSYATFCVSCHGADGTGNEMLGAPDLTDGDWLYGNSAGEISFTITHGRIGVMPAHDDLLSDDQIHILAGYITGLSAADASPSAGATSGDPAGQQ